LVKSRQRNSVIFISDNRRKQAKKFGVALDTFNKYIKRANEAGLLKQTGDHLQMIPLSQIMDKLPLLEKSKNYYWYLKLQQVKTMNFYQITEWVRESLVLYKLSQQQYKISKTIKRIDFLGEFLNQKPFERKTNQRIRRQSKMAGELGLSLEEYYYRVKKNQKKAVVTGCNHLAKEFNNCSSTMNRSLNNLVRRGMISRKVIKKSLDEFDVSHHSYDLIKEVFGVKGLYINKTTNRFTQILGSQISILLNGKHLSNK